MAAAEYFSSAPLMGQQQQSPYQAHTTHPRPPTSNLMNNNYYNNNQSTPQIQTHPPPPYQAQNQDSKPGVHFAPIPTGVEQWYDYSNQQRPNLPPYQNSLQNSYYRPQQIPQSQPRPQYQQQGHGTPPLATLSYGTPPRPQHLSPHMRPYANPNLSQHHLKNGYSSDPEPGRRRRKHHRHHVDRDRQDGEISTRKRSRSSNADGFIGAAGGGLVGDLIFPGLGTLGGVALGWFGGKEYGKGRKGREGRLHEAQESWEARFCPDRHEHHDHGHKHHRDRSHGDGSGRGSPQIGERDRRHSHESKLSHDSKYH